MTSYKDDPDGYWNYNVGNVNERALKGFPYRLADGTPYEVVEKNIMLFSMELRTVDVTVNDDAWHMFTVYSYADGTAAGDLKLFDARICTPEGESLAEYVVGGHYSGSRYYSFAVKGSFQLQLEPREGTKQSALCGMFFDPMEPSADYEKKNVRASLVGAKEVDLTWENGGKDAETAIYRKKTEDPDSAYELLATVGEDVTSYHDEGEVSSSYDYRLVAGYEEDSHKLYTFPTEPVTVKTQQYAATSIELDKTNFTFENVGGESDYLEVTATLTRDDGAAPVPLFDKPLTFRLSGDYVYDTSYTGRNEPNMKAVFTEHEYGDQAGEPIVTDRRGRVTFRYYPEYPGTYQLTAEFAAEPLQNDPAGAVGLDSAAASATLEVTVPARELAPVLYGVGEAIKPGELFSVRGSMLNMDAEQTVMIAPSTGSEYMAYRDDIPGIQELPIVQADYKFAAFLTCRLPEDFKPGAYDIWVKNVYGWSNPVKLNAARVINILQEKAFPGMQFEVVGRNFRPDEFGGENSWENTKVRLVGREGGTAEGEEVILDPLTGVKYAADEAFTGKEIYHSNYYKLTVDLPDDMKPGYYDVYATNDNLCWSKLESIQDFEILDPADKVKSAAEIFGSTAGFDPLDMGVWWANEFNWYDFIEVHHGDGDDAQLASVGVADPHGPCLPSCRTLLPSPFGDQRRRLEPGVRVSARSRAVRQ